MTDAEVKQTIGQCFVDEQRYRAKLRMGFPTSNYNGVKTEPGLIVIVTDFRFIVPDEIAVIDVMCFGPPLEPSYKRWKKRLDQIMSWDRFNPEHSMTDAQIDERVKTTRHKVM